MAVEVSVVIPAHNEESNLVQTVQNAIKELSGFLGTDYEIIIAEDGSTDKSKDIAIDLESRFERTYCRHLKDRKGKGKAIEDALEFSSGDIVALIDGDNSTNPEYIEDILEPVIGDEADITLGSRRIAGAHVERGLPRRILSWGYNNLAGILLGTGLKDHQCGFKAFRREVLEDFKGEIESEHWFWDTEFLAKAEREGYRIRELPVEWTESENSDVDFLEDTLYMGSKLATTSMKLRLARRGR